MGLNKFFVLLTILVLASLTSSAWCGEEQNPAVSQALEISSDTLESDGNLRQVVFAGHVVAMQDGLVIRADKLLISYADQGGRISRIEANGGVRVEKDGRIATGERGVYEIDKGTIVLTGAPRVQQGDNMVEGEEIVYFLEENRSIVKGGSGTRVRAILNPGENAVGP